jgi:hypothetical protein
MIESKKVYHQKVTEVLKGLSGRAVHDLFVKVIHSWYQLRVPLIVLRNC